MYCKNNDALISPVFFFSKTQYMWLVMTYKMYPCTDPSDMNIQ